MESNVHVGDLDCEIFEQLIDACDPFQILIIADNNTMQFVERLHDITELNIDAIQIQAGEQEKNLNSAAAIWNDLTHNNFRRDGLIINLGGGVITDLGGFVAATFKRGVDFINIPTTLLGMVDAAVGGKTGVDFGDFKNQVGVFQSAKHVFCDVAFLETLPKDELLSGYAEVLKYGLTLDGELWSKCIANDWENHDWNELVKTSVDIKSNVVLEDPFEKGKRKLLNFGHTVGHAIEKMYLHNLEEVKHGYAVAAGMICESMLSEMQGFIDEDQLSHISGYLLDTFPKVNFDEREIDQIIEFMSNDKKNTSKDINFTFLSGVGTGVVNQTASKQDIKIVLKKYRSL